MKISLLVLLAALTIFVDLACAAPPISLSGRWRFSLDAADNGQAQRWYARDLPDHAQLPGSLAEQNIGPEPSAQTHWTARIGVNLLSDPKYLPYQIPGDFRTPFWLTPPAYYVGAAWYQRDVEIPSAWADQHVTLFLERPHWQTTVWLDDHRIGSQNSLGTPHEYDLSAFISPGHHRLTIRVDNTVRIPIGLDAHSISDQTQGNWNGIVGKIELRLSDKIWIDDAQVYPEVSTHQITLKLTFGNLTAHAGDGTLTITGAAPATHPIHWDANGGSADLTYDLGPTAQPWDEFSPTLYTLTLQLKSQDGHYADQRAITFGLRQLGVKGTQFTLNGRPIFLRGTLECCIFPLTGYPPTDLAPWTRIMTIARSYGLNHLRFHSWCPPDAAFTAADQMGFYLSVECSCWATAFGRDAALDQWVSDEAQRMMKAYGNHPSFIMMVPSNEPDRQDAAGFLNDLIGRWQNQDARHLYTAGSGWPVTANNQYRVASPPRIQGSHELSHAPQTASDYHAFIQSNRVPVVSHEIGQWCAYPDFTEIPKFSGVMKPGNLEIFRDFLQKSGMGAQAHDFLMATGKFQALLYKEDIEAALRTPGMAGFQLLDLHDFPGQGTAPVGVLDAFWDSKGYISADQYHRFCGPTVPLARMEKRIFTTDENFAAQIQVAHFGPGPLDNAPINWLIRDNTGKILLHGSLPARTIPTGGETALGTLTIPLATIAAPAKLNLQVTVGPNAANDWDFWVYSPQTAPPPPDVHIASTLDAAALTVLQQGGKVLLLPGPAGIAGNTFGSFQPIFWNRITFPTAKVHTAGILCDPSQPALSEFPTDFYTNWQWWDLLQNSKPMVLDGLPRQLTPIVQVIDDWNVCRKLGLIIDGHCGGGKLLICSIDLDHDLAHRPVARQLRKSLLDYMNSAGYSPSADLPPLQVTALLLAGH